MHTTRGHIAVRGSSRACVHGKFAGHRSWGCKAWEMSQACVPLLQATVQQAAGTSDRAPLKGASQPSKGTGKQNGLMNSTAFALCAAALLLIVAAAGGITWYRAGATACLYFLPHVTSCA